MQRQRKKWLYFFLPLIVGVMMLCLPFLKTDFSTLPGDLGDTRFNGVVLENGHRYLSGKNSSFWDLGIFYPEENSKTYSDNLMGWLPLYSPLRTMGFSKYGAMQFLFVLFCLLNYFSFYKVARLLGYDPRWSAMGAFLFTFSLPVFTHIAHLQLLPRFFIPPALLAYYRFFEKADLRSLGYSTCFLFLQFCMGIYLGLFLLVTLMLMSFPLIFAFGKKLIREMNFSNRTKFTIDLLLLFLPAFLLTVLFLPYMERSATMGMKTWEEVSPLSLRWYSFLEPYWYSGIWRWMTPLLPENEILWEHSAFPGIIPLLSFILLFFVLIRNNPVDRMRSWWIPFTGLLLIIFFSNINGFSFFPILMKFVPGVAAMKAISRIVLVLLFFLSLSATHILQHYFRDASLKGWVMILFIVIADQFVILPTGVGMNIQEALQREEILHQQLINHPNYSEKKPFAFLPVNPQEEPDYVWQLDAMAVAQMSGNPTINGFSGGCPEGFWKFWTLPNETHLIERLQQTGLKEDEIIIVH